MRYPIPQEFWQALRREQLIPEAAPTPDRAGGAGPLRKTIAHARHQGLSRSQACCRLRPVRGDARAHCAHSAPEHRGAADADDGGAQSGAPPRRPAHLCQARRPHGRRLRRQQAAQPGIPARPRDGGKTRYRHRRSRPAVQLCAHDRGCLQQDRITHHPRPRRQPAGGGAGQPAGRLSARRRGPICTRRGRAAGHDGPGGARHPRGRRPSLHPQRQPDVRCRVRARVPRLHHGDARPIARAGRRGRLLLHVIRRQGPRPAWRWRKMRSAGASRCAA